MGSGPWSVIRRFDRTASARRATRRASQRLTAMILCCWVWSNRSRWRAAMEEWRTIPGHIGYEASNLGRIRCKGGRLLGQSQTEYGYLRVYIRIGSQRKHKMAHRLVALAYPQGQGSIVRHLDDDKANNRAENLRWGTQKQNHSDSRRNGTASCDRIGSAHPRKREVNLRLLLEAKRRYESGETQQAIAREYGIHPQTLSRKLRKLRKQSRSAAEYVSPFFG